MFVVGIDGGGTKTRVAVCASDGTLLHRETLGAFNLSAIGEDGFRRRVGEILTLCGDMRACGALCVGGAGASGAAMGEILRAELAAHGFAGKLLRDGVCRVLRGPEDAHGKAVGGQIFDGGFKIHGNSSCF